MKILNTMIYLWRNWLFWKFWRAHGKIEEHRTSTLNSIRLLAEFLSIKKKVAEFLYLNLINSLRWFYRTNTETQTDKHYAETTVDATDLQKQTNPRKLSRRILIISLDSLIRLCWKGGEDNVKKPTFSAIGFGGANQWQKILILYKQFLTSSLWVYRMWLNKTVPN